MNENVNYGERPMEYHAGLRWDAEHGIDVGFVPGMDYHENQRLREQAFEEANDDDEFFMNF